MKHIRQYFLEGESSTLTKNLGSIMRLLGDKKVSIFVKLGDKNCKIKLLGSI